MKLIGTKEMMIKRWRDKAETCQELAEIAKTKKEASLFKREAFIYMRCADELQLLEDHEPKSKGD